MFSTSKVIKNIHLYENNYLPQFSLASLLPTQFNGLLNIEDRTWNVGVVKFFLFLP